MAINPQRRPRAAWFRAVADPTQGTIGISAFRAIGASAWAVDSAPLSRAEPMPLPEAVWGCRADHARAAGVPELIGLQGVALVGEQPPRLGQVVCGEVVFPCSLGSGHEPPSSAVPVG